MPNFRLLHSFTPALISLGLYVCVLGMFALAIKFQADRNRIIENEKLQVQGHRLADYLESRLEATLASINALELSLKQNGGGLEGVEFMSNQILAEQPAIKAIGLAPRAVVARIYPIEGNEGGMGLDLSTDSFYKSLLREARRTRKAVLAGPFQSAQGEWTIKLYRPIYLRNDEFWGFITVTANLSEIFQATEIESRLDRNIAYSMARFDPERNELIYFVSTPLPSSDGLFPIHTPNSTWKLELAAKSAPRSSWIAYLFAALFSVLPSLMCLGLLRQREQFMMLATYDRAMDHPNRYEAIINAERVMTRLRDHQGLSALMVVGLEEGPQGEMERDTISRVGQWVSASLRPGDVVAPLDDRHLLVVIGGLPSAEQAHALTQKLFSRCVSQREEIGLKNAVLKGGARLCRRRTNCRVAVIDAFKALQRSRNRLGDALEGLGQAA